MLVYYNSLYPLRYFYKLCMQDVGYLVKENSRAMLPVIHCLVVYAGVRHRR